ncbi:exocyst complex component 3-like protein 4 isoform X2 [Rhineura floridana]|uniref:exocyst complex component 3-like protein 4 isoform X2 n=1 Tax=Rhineura floridana TaxID=261503 RepID=UPI002AC871E0|nr:exocyst complex component 3-like protein 4 isoform X2 [Rhineura floridana]
MELPSESESPAKCMETGNGNCLPKDSPSLHNQGENEPKHCNRGFKATLSFRRRTSKSVEEKSSEANMNENKTETREMVGKTELSSEPKSLAKFMELEDGNCLPKGSPPLNNQGKNFNRGIKAMLSFRRNASKSVKENLSETNLDNNETETKEEDGKTEFPSEPESSVKCIEAEDVKCLPKDSPLLNNQGQNKPNNVNRGIRAMLSFRGSESKSVKEQLTKNKMDENTTEKGGEMALPSEPESPVKCAASDSDNCLPKDPPPLSYQGENEPKNFYRGLGATLSFRRNASKSVKEKSTEESCTSRWSKHSSRGIFKLMDGSNNHPSKENNGIPKESEALAGEDCVQEEPLSVMQINELIQKRQLLEAFRNIKSLEMELLAERDAKKYEDNPKEYVVKAMDVDLLYDSVTKAIQNIVEESLDLPSVHAKALGSLVALIKEEEEAHAGAASITISSEPRSRLGLARNWRELWKETVKESVRRRVFKVPVPLKEDNIHWLSIHLGYLKTVIRQDLLTIKQRLHKCYPQDYSACDAYLKAFHGALSLHLQSILEEDRSLEFNQLYAVLDWVTNVYHSDNFLGCPDLKPEIKTEDLPNLFTPDVLDNLKKDYINSIKRETKRCLENILMLEKWDSEIQPEALQTQYDSSLSFDIQTLISQLMKASGIICKNLEAEVLKISTKEVTEFLPRFGKAFLDKAKDHPQFIIFMVAYLNSFHDLRMGLQTTFNVNCKELEKTVDDLMLRYRKYFLNKLRLETEPLFQKILSRAWVLRSGTLDSFTMQILSVIEEVSKHLLHLKEPICKDFLNEVHKYVVKEYVTKILKRRRRMKRRKREEGSTFDWLFPVIPCIANIIGEREKHKIKDYIRDLSQDYPDIRKKHIDAVLAFHGGRRNKTKSIVDHVDHVDSEELEFGSDRTLFAEIELQNTIQCF